MQKVKLLDIIEKPLSGEWGSEAEDGNGVLVLRTTNFTNEGIINFNSVVRRDLGNKNVDKKYLKKGDIIIEKSGGSDNQPVGRVVYFEAENNKYLFNNFTSVLRVKNDIAFPKYIFYCLFYKYKIGATRPFENKTTGLHNLKLEQYINSILIPLSPMEEQRAIAEKLDKVSQLVDKRKEQLQQLDQLVKSQFISFFGSTDLSDEKKSNVRIGDVAEIVGGSTPKTDIEEYWNGEYFWITPAELKDDSYMIKTTIRKLTKAGVESCSLKKMPVNTVLLSSRAPIGKVAITGVEMYCNQGFKNIICSNKLQPTFIYFLLKYNTKYLNSLGRGATFKEISKSIVENIKIPLPPMEPQNQFAEFVEKVEKLKEKVNNSLTHLNLLKQSLMQQYFG